MEIHGKEAEIPGKAAEIPGKTAKVSWQKAGFKNVPLKGLNICRSVFVNDVHVMNIEMSKSYGVRS